MVSLYKLMLLGHEACYIWYIAIIFSMPRCRKTTLGKISDRAAWGKHGTYYSKLFILACTDSPDSRSVDRMLWQTFSRYHVYPQAARSAVFLSLLSEIFPRSILFRFFLYRELSMLIIQLWMYVHYYQTARSACLRFDRKSFLDLFFSIFFLYRVLGMPIW
jgi:hypothetical protein